MNILQLALSISLIAAFGALQSVEALSRAGGAGGAVAGDADPGWELLVTSAGPEVPRTCFPAPGLPPWSRGAFFISGPALFERGGFRFQGIFDGFGRANRFELRGREGEVCYTSRWLNTGAYAEAKAHNDLGRGVLFEDTKPKRPACPLSHLMCNLEAPNDNNWVSMLEVGGEGVLLSDTPLMVRMDLDTMNCTGVKPWADDTKASGHAAQPDWVSTAHVPFVGSAHPLRRPGTHTWVDVLVEAPMVPGIMHSLVDLYTFEDTTAAKQARKRIASLKADASQYFHSFGVTPNYIVLPFNLMMKMPGLLSTPTLLDNFAPSWKGIHIVDYKGAVQIFDADPFFHTHVVNSFENETGIVFDVGAFQSNPFTKGPVMDVDLFLNKTARDSQPLRGCVRRLHFHLSGPLRGKTTHEDFAAPGRAVDFFKINMALSGLPYCIYYAVEWWHDGEAYASMAVLKHDLCTGTRKYWKRPSTYPGEPFFVPGTSSVEDDGVVVFIALDGPRARSIFVTLDARSFEELAVVELPVHIPFTAHGQFIPDVASADKVVV